MNACAMVNLCFWHQHPEHRGSAEVPEPVIPDTLRYGYDPPDAIPYSRAVLAEEPMGNGGDED